MPRGRSIYIGSRDKGGHEYIKITRYVGDVGVRWDYKKAEGSYSDVESSHGINRLAGLGNTHDASSSFEELQPALVPVTPRNFAGPSSFKQNRTLKNALDINC